MKDNLSEKLRNTIIDYLNIENANIPDDEFVATWREILTEEVQEIVRLLGKSYKLATANGIFEIYPGSNSSVYVYSNNEIETEAEVLINGTIKTKTNSVCIDKRTKLLEHFKEDKDKLSLFLERESKRKIRQLERTIISRTVNN